MAALGIIGIVVGVAVLIYGAYKGISTIILAPLCALLIALFNGMNLLTTFTDTMLPSVCNYVTAMLGPVLMGCVIAALYNASGAALSIANALYDLFTIKARKQAAAGQQVVMKPILAILTIYVIGTVLAYSGMNPVVLMFILFPIAMDLFEKAKMPRAMGPGVVLGALATAACSMPGTTSDQNVIAVQMLGTSPMAAAVPGFIGGAVVLILNIVMMNVISKKEIAKGHVYDAAPNAPKRPEGQKTPHWLLSIIPIAVTLICFNGLGKYDAQHYSFSDFLLPILRKILRTERTDQTGWRADNYAGSSGWFTWSYRWCRSSIPGIPGTDKRIIKHGWSCIIQGSTCNRITDRCIRIRSCWSVRYITVHVRDIRKHGYQHECFAPCIRICISDT